MTGRKETQKMYYRHSGYPGGLKTIPYQRMMATHPDRILRFAVKGMLPKTRLGRQQILKLQDLCRADAPARSPAAQSLHATAERLKHKT